ncbi:MAG: sodium-translocating pyrophosphatase [Candidatus Woesearchaeota archaeon]|nr:MAG: sodium-translocating pyrophosphatase [Candidatus Woesearchaeota archaeon]
MLIYSLIISIIALVSAGILTYVIKKKNSGNEKVQELASLIHKGALTFLKREYRLLAIFVIIVTVLLTLLLSQQTAIAFLVGAIFSISAGNLGVRIATQANGRTAQACTKSASDGLKIAFLSGAVMGLTVVGLGVLGVTALYYFFKDTSILFGFGFGASSVALFARVGGGIYTKTADMGADLVGKVEANIPEDDPRNPGVIADNVGDNVGDVGGMGADLFESYVDAIIGAMSVGAVFSAFRGDLIPLMIASIGIISSIIGIYFVKGKSHSALNRGIFASSVIMIIGSFILLRTNLSLFASVVSGLIAGVLIGLITQYYTSEDHKPTQKVAESSKTGVAVNILGGLSTGMLSTLLPVIIIGVVIIGTYQLSGLYGIAIAAVGLLSTLGITLATDTYGPVADNAAGIAEMAKLGDKVRKRCESLDAIGNTTAAIGKGFAIGSAVLTAIVLFAVFSEQANITINIMEPLVFSGLLLGGMLPFIFSALTIKSVDKAAGKMIEEIRRQFKTGILKGKGKPDYERCISISTDAALYNMILPAGLAVVAPIVVGLVLGPEALGGLLAGSIVTGFLLAITLSNSGGIWDNAKKYIESGHFGGKGSDPHKAAVVGDTVGDPFKDTAGPSLNILLKLMAIVSLVFLPLFL